MATFRWFSASQSEDIQNYIDSLGSNYNKSFIIRDEVVVVSGLSAGVSDHGELDGLSDDDHTQYLLADGSVRDLTGWHKMEYSATGLDDTLTEIISNGAKDAANILEYSGLILTSGGGTKQVRGNLTPGNSTAIYNVGADVLTLSVAADGSVTIQRTGGALTYDVSLTLRWT